jgi:hypothetical protein
MANASVDAGAPVLALLSDPRGFRAALADVYGRDLASFGPGVLVRHLPVDWDFVFDLESRRRALSALGQRVLGEAGLLAFQPGLGSGCTVDGEPLPPLRLCQLLGTCGFAQLCDDALGRPLPLLVCPWSAQDGLLIPRRLPPEPFSRTLVTKRLGTGRMVLFDRRAVPVRAPAIRPAPWRAGKGRARPGC